MLAQRTKNQVMMLEEGDIFLLDWPEAEEAGSEDAANMQRLYLLMHPTGWRNHRLITIGKKESSESGKKAEHYWGHVDEIVRTDRELADHLAEIKHERKKCCHPPLMMMRVVGMGEYQLVRHGNHTQLCYELTPPKLCNENPQALNIESSATYFIGVKDCNNPTPRAVAVKRGKKAEALQPSHDYYSSRGFLTAEPELLNQEGVEILLISTDGIGML